MDYLHLSSKKYKLLKQVGCKSLSSSRDQFEKGCLLAHSNFNLTVYASIVLRVITVCQHSVKGDHCMPA